MATYQIGGVTFRSKHEIVQHARGILHRTPIGEMLDPIAFAFMLELLQRHRWAAQKIGVGVRAMRVDLNTHWKPYKMFTVIRADGSETDFSYRACIYPTSADADFRKACRHAIVEDVLAFKQAAFEAHANEFNEIRCAVSGELVAWDEAHVDHAPPWTFRAIADAFIRGSDIDVSVVSLAGSADNECQHRFADMKLAERFRSFHNERACLRVVTKAVNLERCR